MTHDAPHREVGRPRVYSDDVIFGATHRTLLAGGYPEVTLEAIALEVGCTRQALVRRFGSKRALMLAFLMDLSGQISADYAKVRERAVSPLDALRTRFVAGPEQRLEQSADPRVEANILSFTLTASADPDFARHFAAINQIFMDEIARLLRDAHVQGELQLEDPTTLARVLFSLWVGETISWCVDPSIDYSAWLSEMFDLVVAPYRTLSTAALSAKG